jgi:predicted ArsR family transcriptional regulator
MSDHPSGGTEDAALDTTRGRILGLLCRGPCTVNELAAELGLTDNAVRAQLERLARDGLVRQAGTRPGTRKPHADYGLTPEARRVFPRAYEPVLKHLVDVLADRLPPEQTAAMLKEVAGRLFREGIGEIRSGEPAARLAEVVERLGGLGAGIHVQESTEGVQVRAGGCPLATVTANHPELCELLARVLGEVLGGEVRQRCDREDIPRCLFELPAAPESDSPTHDPS